jgi:hypothetical protein
MNREQLLQRMERGWISFQATFEGLSDPVLLEPGVVGEWSIRDIMTHIAIWEEEALEALPLILEGKSTIRYTRYGGIDAFNAMSIGKKSHLSLNEVRDEMITTHKRLMDFLSGKPETA